MKKPTIKKYFSAALLTVLLISILMIAYFLINYNKVADEIETECVPAQCCHPISCVEKSQAPDCSGKFCTQECAPGSLDCGQGSCKAIKGKCEAAFN